MTGRSEPVRVDVENPCKHADDTRTYLCLYCRKLSFVCRRCERGQIYCGPLCSDAGRRRSLARARRSYRNSDRGRQMACRRQARHREQRGQEDCWCPTDGRTEPRACAKRTLYRPRASPRQKAGSTRCEVGCEDAVDQRTQGGRCRVNFSASKIPPTDRPGVHCVPC